MDPIILATVTAAVTALASESAKGIASEAAKDAWTTIKSLLGLEPEPAPEALASSVAERLLRDAELAKQIIHLLQDRGTGTASALVSTINAEKVVVANKINIVNM